MDCEVLIKQKSMCTSLNQQFLTEASFSNSEQLEKGKEKIMACTVPEHLVYTKHAWRDSKNGIKSSYDLEMLLGEHLLPLSTFSKKKKLIQWC